MMLSKKKSGCRIIKTLEYTNGWIEFIWFFLSLRAPIYKEEEKQLISPIVAYAIVTFSLI